MNEANFTVKYQPTIQMTTNSILTYTVLASTFDHYTTKQQLAH